MTGVPVPALSVVVVSLGEADDLRRVLAALAREGTGAPLEVIVPATPRVQRLLEALGTGVTAPLRVLPLADPDEDAWRMRSRGVAAAAAPLVATLEDHAVPAPGWAAAVLRAHARPHAAVGGVVEKVTPDGVTGWAMYFLDYGRYIPPQRAGPRRFLSACNVSYKRAALWAVADAWRETMHETAVHDALRDRGDTLWLDPAIVVRQRRRLPAGDALAELRRHGELFGRDLGASHGEWWRLARAALTLLAPLVHLGRAVGHTLRSPRLLPGFLVAAPGLVVFALVWCAGEAAGLLRPADR